jgi:hypothetical protein
MSDRTCPVCGNAVWDGVGERPPGQLCTPASCPAWTTEARYDHDDHAWLPVDDDGVDLKGHR